MGGLEHHSALLATDDAGSVLSRYGAAGRHSIAYCVFGHTPVPASHAPAFTGQWYEAQAAGYLLGNGYRVFNPRLMRFHSPDSFSPFGEAGLNTYTYCEGNPINDSDPSGHFSLKKIRTIFSNIFGNTRNSHSSLANRIGPEILTTKGAKRKWKKIFPGTKLPAEEASTFKYLLKNRAMTLAKSVPKTGVQTNFERALLANARAARAINALHPSAPTRAFRNPGLKEKGYGITTLTGDDAAKFRRQMDRAITLANASKTAAGTGTVGGPNLPPGLSNLNIKSKWVRHTAPNKPW